MKKSFNLVYLLTILTLFFAIALVLNQSEETFQYFTVIKIFNESYIIDKLSIFMKVLTLYYFACLFCFHLTDYVKSTVILIK